MARSRLIFGKTTEGLHSLDVEGDPEKVVETLRNEWAQLNTAREGEEPKWVWVNAANVLYVQPRPSGRVGRVTAL